MQSLANQSQPRSAISAAAQISIVVLGFAIFLCGLFVALQTVYLAIRLRTALLLADEWRVLPRFIEVEAGKLSLLSFLWEDHFGHRPALARLFFILDAAIANGTQALPKTISLCLCVLLTALFVMLLLQQKPIPWGLRLLGAGLLILTLLPNQQVHNLLIGWNNAILTTVFFSVLALYCLVKSIEKTTNGSRALLLFVCALLSGILGTCSMANGLLIWPIMFLICALFRAWSWATIVALVGAAMTAIYLWGFQRTGMLLDALQQPGALLAYLVAFLGNPVMALGLGASTVFGALGILLVGYHFLRQGRRADRDALTVWFLLGVSLFVIGTAALTSLGRLSFGAEVGAQTSNVSATGPLALRYYSFIAPLWAVILLLGFIRLKQDSQTASGNAWAISDTGALVVSIGMCASAYVMGPTADWLTFNRYERFEHAATAIVAGAPDQTVLKYIYPFPDVDMLALAPYLAAHRLSVFHSDADFFLYQRVREALHQPLPAGMSLDGKWCAGSIDEMDKVETNPTWNFMTGSASDRETEQPPDGVFFADEQSRLVGIGRIMSANARTKSRYIGYAELGASQSVIGYAFKFGRNDLCRFGEQNMHQ